VVGNTVSGLVSPGGINCWQLCVRVQAYYALAQKHHLSSIDDLLKPEYVHYCLESLPMHGAKKPRHAAASLLRGGLNALILRHYHTFPPLVTVLHPHQRNGLDRVPY
jgi:hypothetical protein